MYWQYTTAFAVFVVVAMNPIVRRANDATAIAVFIFFSHVLADISANQPPVRPSSHACAVQSAAFRRCIFDAGEG